ncbi:MAG TPA: DUF2339 domain-containing protein [Patescibacteria group bacterium]|nr:DUF2339 domain-containing protein [Patescibacteria group bacterium]
MTLLIALFVVLLVALPALAIYASARMRGIETRKPGSVQSGVQGAVRPPLESLRTLQERLDAIEKRLSALEGRAAAPPAAAAQTVPSPISPSPATAPSAKPATARTVILPEPGAPKKTKFDWESVVAERWLNYFGIIAILFAAAFFIQYAFDSHWVGPRGRVAVGLLAGAVVALWSEPLMRRGYRYFSEGIAGLGVSVLYLSIWGGWHYYRLFTAPAALAGMSLVTAATAALAVRRDSQRLIVMALAGGFLSPILLFTGREHEFLLFSYNAVLAAGMLGVERLRRWPWLPLLTFFSVESYFWIWYAPRYSPGQLWPTVGFATLFFLLFAALPVIHGRRTGRLTAPELFVVTANLCFYLLALWMLLQPGHRWLLTAVFLALAAAHLAERRVLPEGSPALRRLMGAMALLSATLAIPARIDHQWLTMAWALEGAAVVWAGARIGSWRVRAAGMLLLGVLALRLAVLEIPAHLLLWNARLGTFAVCVGCFACAAAALRRSAGGMQAGENTVRGVLRVAVSGYSLLALSFEVWDLFGRLALGGMEHRAAQQMGLSLLWTLFATGLILLGIFRKSALLRWEALVLFGLTVGKVFLHDLASLERLYRILSFLVLGILLLVVSFLYQRRAIAQKEARALGSIKKTG